MAHQKQQKKFKKPSCR